MRKKIKLCILIFIIIVASIILHYVLINQYTVRTAIITSIDNDKIKVNSPSMSHRDFPISTLIYDKNGDIIDISQINKGDIIYINSEVLLGEPPTLAHNFIACIYEGKSDTEIMTTYIQSHLYELSTQDVTIKDNNGYDIDISCLNIGDTIQILYKESKEKITLKYEREPIENIKSIKLLAKGLPNYFDRYIYNSTDKLLMTVLEFTDEKLSLKIKDLNQEPFAFTNSYMLLSGDEYSKNLQEVDMLAKDKVKILNHLDNTFEEQFDLNKVFGKLESGKYRLIQFLDEPYAIRIDFEIQENKNVIYENPTIEKFYVVK